jgi:hypothetical protein
MKPMTGGSVRKNLRIDNGFLRTGPAQINREIAYGETFANGRLQRVFDVVKRPQPAGIISR